MADLELFGPGPFGFHLANVLLHAANAALLFWFLFRATGSRWRSFFVAAFFALHPLRAGTGAAEGYSALLRLALVPGNVWTYLQLTIWPAHLFVLYPENDVVAAGTALAAFAGLVWRPFPNWQCMWRDARRLPFGPARTVCVQRRTRRRRKNALNYYAPPAPSPQFHPIFSQVKRSKLF